MRIRSAHEARRDDGGQTASGQRLVGYGCRRRGGGGGVNLSRVAEAALRTAIKQERERRWRDENREALARVAEWYERNGDPLARLAPLQAALDMPPSGF